MIHVLIERLIADDMEQTYEQAARSTLHQAFSAPGFIRGEAFTDINNPMHRFIVCKFRTARDWHQWAESDARRLMMNLIYPALAEPEKVTLLEN
ncbi:antibiotic biosynthesis monooxygenase family protein [Simiduia aestuariiviva]|uniref:Heme-degrading monooxygenase HmoA n=1 Tax=Simiduia aestuariiviva TaxID=1510459 RepID=A0A839UTP0_9GAMM|nr:antibiotic biosynthesis monooxygenase [Simiduia aestuariiviva]MBB3168747.1 heme-degrading monooxygenase HmoA [Simiduia aestuariiviva]